MPLLGKALTEGATALATSPGFQKKLVKHLKKSGVPDTVLRQAEIESAARAARLKALASTPEIRKKLADADALARITDPKQPLGGLDMDEYIKRARILYDDLVKLAGPGELGDKLIQPLWLACAGRVRPYRELKEASSFINAVLAATHPNAFRAGARLDAHHIIEQHTFELFKSDFELLGWKSPDEMPAILLETEYHIRSPRRLLGIQDGPDAPVRPNSLTRDLLSLIVKKHTKLEDALAAYRAYYMKAEGPFLVKGEVVKPSVSHWKYIGPFFDGKDGLVARLARLRSQQALVKKIKSSSASP